MHSHTSYNKLLSAVTAGVTLLLVVMVVLAHSYFNATQQLATAAEQLTQRLSTPSLSVEAVHNKLIHEMAGGLLSYGKIMDAAGQVLLSPVKPANLSSIPPLAMTEIRTHLQRGELVPFSGTGDYVIELPASQVRPGLLVQLGFTQPSLLGGLTNTNTLMAMLALAALLLIYHAVHYGLYNRANKKLNRYLHDCTQSLPEVPQADVTPAHPIGDALGELIEAFRSHVEHINHEQQDRAIEEKFLSYRADRYASILETIPDGILILDEDFKVTYLNQHVEHMYNIDRTEVISAPVEAWCDTAALLDYIKLCRREGRRAMANDVYIPHPRSAQRTLKISMQPLLSLKEHNSSERNTLLLMSDATQEITAKNSRAEFVGNVSHEIKAPLNTIGLYAQMLESNADDPDFVIDAHNTITQEVDRLSRLVSNLLSMTQIEMGTFELDTQRVHLSDLVDECTAMLDHGEDKARIKRSGPDKLPAVMVDKELMRVAISNLLTNALKYSDSGSPVLVELDETNQAISLSVTDQGPGISQEEQKQIFEKFFRSESEAARNKPGHGLGLAITQEIIRLHHGSISVRSEINKGSRFTIELWKHAGSVQQAI